MRIPTIVLVTTILPFVYALPQVPLNTLDHTSNSMINTVYTPLERRGFLSSLFHTVKNCIVGTCSSNHGNADNEMNGVNPHSSEYDHHDYHPISNTATVRSQAPHTLVHDAAGGAAGAFIFHEASKLRKKLRDKRKAKAKLSSSTETPSIAVSETATPDSAPSPPESEIPAAPAAPASDTSV